MRGGDHPAVGDQWCGIHCSALLSLSFGYRLPLPLSAEGTQLCGQEPVSEVSLPSVQVPFLTLPDGGAVIQSLEFFFSPRP